MGRLISIQKKAPGFPGAFLYDRFACFLVYKDDTQLCIQSLGHLLQFGNLESVSFIFVVEILRGLPCSPCQLGLGHIATLDAAKTDIFAGAAIERNLSMME